MITKDSTYEECVKEIDLGVQDCMADFGDEMEISEDEIWVDIARSVLVDASEDVAREVCRCQIGWMPEDLKRHFQGGRS
jgi:hypothetical protein